MKAMVRRAVWRDGASRPDDLAEEIPVAFEYNGISHAVMLATPDDLEDFAVGFSLSEGIVARRQEIFDIGVSASAAGITLQIEIAGDAFARLKQRVLSPLPQAAAFPLAALYAGMRSLPLQQFLQQATGATHAACCVERDGSIDCVREDVGRHNALDKTLGALVRKGGVAGERALVITSRASFEMVQKAAAMGAGTLAAVSAPTAAAVRLAEKLNLTLIGFLRQEACVIYTGNMTEAIA